MKMFYISALLGAMEMLKTGCTTNVDHFFGNQNSRYTGAGEAIRAMRDLGLRHVVALTVTDRLLRVHHPHRSAPGRDQRRSEPDDQRGNQGYPRLAE